MPATGPGSARTVAAVAEVLVAMQAQDVVFLAQTFKHANTRSRYRHPVQGNPVFRAHSSDLNANEALMATSRRCFAVLTAVEVVSSRVQARALCQEPWRRRRAAGG